MAVQSPTPVHPRHDRTLVIVSMHGSLRNWAEKRLYEPLLGMHNISELTRRQQNSRKRYGRYSYNEHAKRWRAMVEGDAPQGGRSALTGRA